MRRISAFVLLFVALLALTLTVAADKEKRSEVVIERAKGPVRKFIVTFPPKTSATVIDEAITSLESKGAKITHRYSKVINGFAVEMPEMADFGLEEMRAIEGVESVEEDGIVSVNV